MSFSNVCLLVIKPVFIKLTLVIKPVFIKLTLVIKPVFISD